MDSMSKQINVNLSPILPIDGTNIRIQRSLKDIDSKVQNVNEVPDCINKSLNEVPSQKELMGYAIAMEEQAVQIQEGKTGLSTTQWKDIKFPNPVSIISVSRYLNRDHRQWYILTEKVISEPMLPADDIHQQQL
jgi:hypothetical protein